MIIAIPTDRNEGLDSPVFPHFGSAPFFILYNTESKSTESINNAQQEHAHGQCNPVGALAGSKIDIIVTGGMGRRALMKLEESGIKAYLAPSDATVGKAIGLITDRKLQQLTAEGACSGHQDCE